MNNLIKKPLFWTNVVAFSVAGLVIAGVAFGWTNPSGTPPAGSGAVNADTSGNVGIGISASTAYKLNVSGKSRGTEICIGSECRSSWPLETAGTPLLNRVTKFTDVGSVKKIGNSIIFDNGTNVGIGNDAPTKKLDVVGGVKATEFCIGTNCLTGLGPFVANKIPKAVTATTLGDSQITDNGTNVGIGIIAPATPARKLHVGAVGFRLTPGALPATPAAGDIAIDSAAGNKLKWYNGTAWVTSAPAAICTYSGRTYSTGAKCKVAYTPCTHITSFSFSGSSSYTLNTCSSDGSWLVSYPSFTCASPGLPVDC